MKWNFYIYHSGSRFINSVTVHDKFLPNMKEYLKREKKKYWPESSFHCEYCLIFIIKMLQKNENKSFLVYKDKELSNDKTTVYSALYGFKEKSKYTRTWWFELGKTFEDINKLEDDLSFQKATKQIESIFYENFKKVIKQISKQTLKNRGKNILIKTPLLGRIWNLDPLGLIWKSEFEIDENEDE